jgi:PAS domain S-box-containing protein
LASNTILVAKDGKERSIEDSASPIRDREGRVAGCVLVFRDVSSRRQWEKQRADQLAATRVLAAIVESSDDAIISKSLDGIIRSWNEGASRLFGYTADEAMGRHISLIIPSERLNEEEHIIQQLRAGRRIENFDTVRLRKDGSSIHVSLTISPIKDEAGHVVGASKTARDITRQKQSEAESRSQNERLRLLSESAAVLLSTDDADAMLRSLVAKIGPQLGVDAYFNYLVNDAGDGLRLASCAGVPEESITGLSRLELGQAIGGTVALQRQPIHREHIQQSDDPKAEPIKLPSCWDFALTPATP